MANQTEKRLAYDAGRAAYDEPPERRSVDACPFPEGDPQRAEWLAGFADRMDEAPDPVDLKKQVAAARKAAE